MTDNNSITDFRYPADWNEQEQQVFMSAANVMIGQRFGGTAAIVRREVVNTFTDKLGDSILMVDALVQFQKWLPDNAVAFEIETAEPGRLSITVTAPAGAGTVSVTLDASLISADGLIMGAASRRATVTNLVSMGLVHMADIRAMYPANGQSKPTGSQPAPEGKPKLAKKEAKPEIERHTASGFVVKQDGEKLYMRVRAGWFEKFGAPIYPEVLQEAGLDEYLDLEPGEYDFNYVVDAEVTPQAGGKKQVKIVKIIL
jgi:hypothetical protein